MFAAITEISSCFSSLSPFLLFFLLPLPLFSCSYSSFVFFPSPFLLLFLLLFFYIVYSPLLVCSSHAIPLSPSHLESQHSLSPQAWQGWWACPCLPSLPTHLSTEVWKEIYILIRATPRPFERDLGMKCAQSISCVIERCCRRGVDFGWELGLIAHENPISNLWMLWQICPNSIWSYSMIIY